MSWVLVVLFSYEMTDGITNKGGVLELNTYDTAESCWTAANDAIIEIAKFEASEFKIPALYLCIPKPA